MAHELGRGSEKEPRLAFSVECLQMENLLICFIHLQKIHKQDA